MIFLKAAGMPRLLKKGDWPTKPKSPPVKFYSEQQVKRLYSAAVDGEERFTVDFLLKTGQRRDEARHAEYDDVDYTGNNTVQVMEKPHLGWKPKTPESCRSIPIPQDLVAAIAERRRTAKSSLIFDDGNGGLTSKNYLCRVVRRFAKRAGLECDVDCHTFRRTFGTRWAGRKPIHVVMQLLGHKRVETTLRYLAAAQMHSPEMQEATESVFADVPSKPPSNPTRKAEIIEMAVA
jgi:integrase